MRPSAQPFLWKWVLFAREWKIISMSKAEHLTSFWCRGLGELSNFISDVKWILQQLSDFYRTDWSKAMFSKSTDHLNNVTVPQSAISEFLQASKTRFQNEVKCSAFDMEMILHSHANKTHFHKKDCALGLILKVRVFELRSGPFVFSFCLEISTEMDVINCQLCSETTHLRLVGST